MLQERAVVRVQVKGRSQRPPKSVAHSHGCVVRNSEATSRSLAGARYSSPSPICLQSSPGTGLNPLEKSPMSSLRNAVKRVAHKERSQPHHRRRLGLLEKHQDYVERAADFKRKRAVIKTLRRKAEERNPDEFYFKMHRSEVRGGKHRDLVEERRRVIDNKTAFLLKTQDMGYLANKKAVEERKVEKLKSGLHLVGAARPVHKVFVDSEEQVEAFDPAQHFQTTPELVHRVHNRPRVEDLEKAAELGQALSSPSLARTSKQVTAAYEELRNRIHRKQKIGRAMEELRLQRALMSGKGTVEKRKVSGEDGRERVVFKWKRQRLR